jgi:predicted enzyme related to lactoylglutathione lyase
MANHPIVHVDIPAINGRESAEFYAKTFDWKLDHAPQFDYWQFAAEGGPGGGFMQAGPDGATINQLVVYIGTDDIEASLADVEANGGKTIQPKTEITGIGWFAVFSDPVGNAVALYQDGGMQQGQ